MAFNPTDEIEVPKLEKRLPARLSKQDSMRILEVVDNYPYSDKFLRYRNYAIFAMFILAGLRKKELLSLKCTDVEIENLSVFIRQGKGSKDRVVPINYRLAEALKKYMEETTEYGNNPKKNPEYVSRDEERLARPDTWLGVYKGIDSYSPRDYQPYTALAHKNFWLNR